MTRATGTGDWSKDEDERLISAVKTYGSKNWKAIAELVKTRNFTQCNQRWRKSLRPDLVKGKWTPEEDQQLRDAIDQHGPNSWRAVARLVPGRNTKQCKERWCKYLDPGINIGSWTPQEDAILLAAYDKHSGCWAQIAQELPGRTDNMVKVRYKSLARKRVKALKKKMALQQLKNSIGAHQMAGPAPGPNGQIIGMYPQHVQQMHMHMGNANIPQSPAQMQGPPMPYGQAPYQPPAPLPQSQMQPQMQNYAMRPHVPHEPAPPAVQLQQREMCMERDPHTQQILFRYASELANKTYQQQQLQRRQQMQQYQPMQQLHQAQLPQDNAQQYQMPNQPAYGQPAMLQYGTYGAPQYQYNGAPGLPQQQQLQQQQQQPQQLAQQPQQVQSQPQYSPSYSQPTKRKAPSAGSVAPSNVDKTRRLTHMAPRMNMAPKNLAMQPDAAVVYRQTYGQGNTQYKMQPTPQPAPSTRVR
eukprot:CAMPEP_0195522554 /NCGR_PEP_ID=MMETSP0794_2-20130614/20825_1 /TAXON_ID=515487 /ORGANISM="Stephanopyxis turris, Strain CCMP 815" /LENGTH=468 /DNA_ID=CAMNT_0040652331 /DNA_START=68 /DNA_END=1474 /DNA_ORIENTATION=-